MAAQYLRATFFQKEYFSRSFAPRKGVSILNNPPPRQYSTCFHRKSPPQAGRDLFFLCVLLISSWLLKRLVMVFKKKKKVSCDLSQTLSGNVTLKYACEMQCTIQRGRVGTGITTAGLICKLYAKSQVVKKKKQKTKKPLVTVKKGLRATSSGSRQETTCFLSNECDQSWISVC